MAAALFLFAALAIAEPATPATPVETDAALFDAAVGCAAYHVYSASTSAPGSEPAKQSEDKAIMFLLASYAKMPQDKPEEAEAKIEETVKGLFEDAETVEPEKHKSEIEQLKQVCIAFEPTAMKIVEDAGYTDQK
jgi:hypothetical protein